MRLKLRQSKCVSRRLIFAAAVPLDECDCGQGGTDKGMGESVSFAVVLNLVQRAQYEILVLVIASFNKRAQEHCFAPELHTGGEDVSFFEGDP